MFKKIVRFVLGAILLVIVALVGLFGYFWYTPEPPPPHTSAQAQKGSIEVDGMARTYLSYVPADLPENAPLLIVFHGSLQDSAAMRLSTGYEFETLADAHHFAVVYPDGYKGNWDDCRLHADYPARAEHIDDEGLVRALIAHFQEANRIDPKRVFVMGYSNGGHMAMRLAVETPDLIAGAALVSASLPTEDNNDCTRSGQPVPVLVMAGTDDPINPFGGGVVSLFGFQPRGTVISPTATAQYFAGLAGYTDAPQPTTLPHQPDSGDTAVQVIDYRAEGKPEVIEYIISGGGHVVPQPVVQAQRILGKMTHDVDAPAVIWDFFARQKPSGQ